MATVAELGQQVKAKYPGQYDDLADDELGRRVKAKFPEEYGDYADTPAAAPAPSGPGVPTAITEGAAQGLSGNLSDEIAGAKTVVRRGGALPKVLTSLVPFVGPMISTSTADDIRKRVSESKDLPVGEQMKREVMGDPTGQSLSGLVTGAEPEGPGKWYREGRDEERAAIEEARKAHPGAFIAGEIGGAVASPLAKLLAPARGASLASRVVQGVGTGAGAGAVYGAGGSNAEDAAGVALDTAGGAAGGAALGGALPAVGAGLKKVLGPAGEWLLKKAGMRAVRSTEAPKGALDKINAESPTRVARLGQAMLEEPGLKLRSPTTILRSSKGAADRYVEQMKGAIDEATKSGVQVDLGAATSKLPFNAAELGGRVRSSLGVAQKDDPLVLLESLGMDGARREVSPSELWAIRRRLDAFLRGPKNTADPNTTALKQQVGELRSAISDALGQAAEEAGQGEAWRAGNEGFSFMRDAARLSTKGVNKAGNIVGASELLTAGPAAVAGMAHSGASGGLLAALGAAAASKAAKTWGNPVLARSAQGLGNAATWAAGTEQPVMSRIALPTTLDQLIESLRARRLGLSLPSAAAQEDDRR